MRTLEELVNREEPAMPLVFQWIAQSAWRVEVLNPSEERGDVLTDLQVTTRSPMGAIAYETGGIFIDHGWLRILGSGHPKLPRNIVDWNSNRSSGHLLVADDVIGGFFSINGGALGDDRGSVYYWAPDTLRWEPLGLGYSDFLAWALSDKLAVFYEGFRWPKWEAEAEQVKGDQCFNFYPFLWTEQGSVGSSSRKLISVAEQYAFNADAGA
ncbi:DUF2625 domain-containing protein [Hydrogenophaga sp. H7]|uniref:DUF2625 domain-containing protein n=1 Tax=Hydrogenophaga sp. H7 TaxID=1882399 RepID=UPI0009A44098|nr:DUF2625 domain-containing protein [Hydrogenophaga sp. H7]